MQAFTRQHKPSLSALDIPWCIPLSTGHPHFQCGPGCAWLGTKVVSFPRSLHPGGQSHAIPHFHRTRGCRLPPEGFARKVDGTYTRVCGLQKAPMSVAKHLSTCAAVSGSMPSLTRCCRSWVSNSGSLCSASMRSERFTSTPSCKAHVIVIFKFSLAETSCPLLLNIFRLL